jgi:RimJ/RimL family protein N-acetyltransferase
MRDAEELFLQELRAVHMAKRVKEAKPIKVAAIIFVDNNASMLVAEKLGYVKESTSKVPGMSKTVHTYCKTLVCI